MTTGAKDVLYRIRVFFIPYLLILCACLLIKLIYTRDEIYFAVNALYTDWGDIAAPYVTDLGDGVVIITISVLLALFNYRASFLLITSYALTSAVAQLVKYSVNMPRPKIYFESQLSKIHFVKDEYILVHRSFPSGHTVTAFSAGVVFVYFVKNKMWGPLFLFLALAVGYSRMYLSQHFFEDVMAGSVIGVMITVLWLGFIDGKKFINSPGWNRGLIKTLSRN
jgi:membrane-associated phospholipid phosphatase